MDDNEYTLIQLVNGEECIQYVRDSKPDLIILDVIMPGISGNGVLEFIRSKYTSNELPVIMATAKDAD